MRAPRLSPALTAIVTAATIGLIPGAAGASNLLVRGVAGVGGTTCALVDGHQDSASMATTCGNGNGRTLNAIYQNSTAAVGQGAAAHAWIDAPAGVSIDTISVNYCSNMNANVGWGGGSFWGPSSQ